MAHRSGALTRGDVSEPLLELTDVDFAYGAVQVLFGVHVTVAPGERLALLGTNGAGKSTLLRIVAGLAQPDRGRVSFAGEDVTGSSVVAMVERGVVLMPGGRAVFPDMTVAENLDVGAHTLRSRPTLAAERRANALELFPRLGERLRTPAGALSGGEQQQLALAKAMLLEPRLMCIDELSLGLAPVAMQGLLDAVRAISERGTTVVLVEQSLNIANVVCERAVFMEKGAVRFEGRVEDLLASSDIARAVFLGATG